MQRIGPYVIVTPVRNEEAVISRTIESVASQRVLPVEWIIINDGSTDGTREILEDAALNHPWIKLLHRIDRGFRRPGTGVMEAVHDGLAIMQTRNWEFLVKLDADLSFESNYFEECLDHFAADCKLGIGGGVICANTQGEARAEVQGEPQFHVRGANKIYRRTCWDAIDGLIRSTGWDTLDEVKANMLGWRTYIFKELKVVQLKPSGSADGVWVNWFKNGRANYIVGYHPLFMLTKCIKRLLDRPLGIVSLALWCGFMTGYLKHIPRPCGEDVVRYLRQQQIRKLTFRNSLWD